MPSRLKIVFSVIVGAFCLFYVQNIFSAPTSTGSSLSEFHKLQYRQIYELLPISQVQMGELLGIEQKIGHFERIHDRLDATQTQLQGDKAQVTKKKHSFEEYLAEADDDIKMLEKTVKRTLEDIARINTELLELSKKIDEIDEIILENKKQIRTYITLSYQQNGTLFHADGNVDVLYALVQGSSDLGTHMRRSKNKTLLSELGKSMLARNQDLLSQQYTMRKNMKSLKDEKNHQKFRLSQYKKGVQIQRSYQTKLLGFAEKRQADLNKNLQKNRDVYETVIDDVEKLRDEYEKEIKELQSANGCEGLDNEVCNYIDQYYQAEKKLRDEYLGKEKTEFVWPIAPEAGIGAYFKDPLYHKALGAPHYAIDIRAHQGTDIIAPASGYVIYLNSPRRGNYSYLAIKHPDGFITVYGHLSEVFVDRFDFVEKGQVFAKSGGAQGTPGAGPISTGPHLHFEMYLKSDAVDPLRHLDLTEIPDEHVAKRYRYKYYLDARENDPSTRRSHLKERIKLFYLIGETEIDRQKYLLNTYASRDFGYWNNWAKYSALNGIDPSFTMCIGFAESSLGANLTTGYNVGNVGNTDSGARRQFESPKEGIQAVLATLNGRFLGKYTKLSQLSGWAHHGGNIYASDTVNWHENMISCLSALKDEFVSDDYEYRIDSKTMKHYLSLSNEYKR